MVIAAFADRTGGWRGAAPRPLWVARLGGGLDERQADGLVILAQSAAAGAGLASDEIRRGTEDAAAPGGAGAVILGGSRPMLDLLEHLHRFAACDMPVLVTGEAGTGRRLAARAIHERSDRRSGPFVAFNCAAVPADLIGAELFGREASAGGAARRPGQIERADRGTLLLDEIDSIPDNLQPLVLRLLHGEDIHPVGGRRPLPVDVRIVATASSRLRGRVSGGALSGDFYHGPRVLQLHLPPLRERNGDVELLATYFLRRIGRELGRELHGFTPLALAAMLGYPWPGNVGELLAAVQRAAVLAAGPLADAADLRLGPPPRQAARPRPRPRAIFRPKPASDGEREAVLQALRDSKFNMTRAAQLLGVARATLYRMLERNRIELAQSYRVQPPAPDR